MADPMHQFEIHKVVDLPSFTLPGVGAIDMSITNSTVAMLAAATVVILFFAVTTAKAAVVPGRLQVIGEGIFSYIDDLVVGIIGNEGRKFFPYIFTLFVFILAIKYWQKREYAFYALVVITLSYILAIMISSYNEELMSDFRHVAVQGRYLFPVLGSFYVLVSHFISQITNKWISKITLAYTLLLFTLGGPVMFLLVFARTNAVGWFY